MACMLLLHRSTGETMYKQQLPFYPSSRSIGSSGATMTTMCHTPCMGLSIGKLPRYRNPYLPQLAPLQSPGLLQYNQSRESSVGSEESSSPLDGGWRPYLLMCANIWNGIAGRNWHARSNHSIRKWILSQSFQFDARATRRWWWWFIVLSANLPGQQMTGVCRTIFTVRWQIGVNRLSAGLQLNYTPTSCISLRVAGRRRFVPERRTANQSSILCS